MRFEKIPKGQCLKRAQVPFDLTIIFRYLSERLFVSINLRMCISLGPFLEMYKVKQKSRKKIVEHLNSIFDTMSSVLVPSHQAMSTIRSSIQATLKAELPPDVLAGVVAPFLMSVNQWASQIPLLLDGNSVASVNLVFAIRSDLFQAPRFVQNVFGLPLVELPPPYQEFVAFIHKLIEAQKVTNKVSPFRYILLAASFLISLSFSLSSVLDGLFVLNLI
jgi:hypothetical protein